MSENHTRSVAKAMSWRVFATLTTMTVVFLFTGQLLLSLGVGATEVLSKLVLYYAHERIWDKIQWGKIIPSA